MIKIILKYIKLPIIFLFVFTFFWFLNSGFLFNPIWLTIQSLFFTIASFLIFKYQKIKLIYYFTFVGTLYVAAALFEIFQLPFLSVISASTGFGILIILFIFQVFKDLINRLVGDRLNEK